MPGRANADQPKILEEPRAIAVHFASSLNLVSSSRRRTLQQREPANKVEAFVAVAARELVISGTTSAAGAATFLPCLHEIVLQTQGESPLRTSRRETLAKLIRSVLTQTDLPRLRLSSIEPMDWDSDLIALFGGFGVGEFGGSRLARHAHLPLQSGSDAVLRRMHRRYRLGTTPTKPPLSRSAAGPDLTAWRRRHGRLSRRN